MAKTVKYSEVLHQWSGTAIIREDGQLKEVVLGVVHTDKKLKESGVKELFTEQGLTPENAIAIEVTKNVDVVTTYEMEVSEFVKLAKVVEVDETTEETAEPQTQA